MSKIIDKVRQKYGAIEHNKHRTDLDQLFIEKDNKTTSKTKQKL